MESGLPEIFDLIPDSAPDNGEEPAIVDASVLYDTAWAESVLNNRSAETVTFRAENPSRIHALSKLADGVEGEAVDDSFYSEGPRFSAILGTMTHKLMEMLVTTGNSLDVDTAIGEIISEFITPGTEKYEDGFRASLRKVDTTMRAGGYVQTNGLQQDLLGTLLAADEVYCELPFCYMDKSNDERTVWNGIMDVVYLVDGKWHIVDYKTNADGSDLDLRYRGQLEAYVKAFKAITGYEADARTYHIDI